MYPTPNSCLKNFFNFPRKASQKRWDHTDRSRRREDHYPTACTGCLRLLYKQLCFPAYTSDQHDFPGDFALTWTLVSKLQLPTTPWHLFFFHRMPTPLGTILLLDYSQAEHTSQCQEDFCGARRMDHCALPLRRRCLYTYLHSLLTHLFTSLSDMTCEMWNGHWATT